MQNARAPSGSPSRSLQPSILLPPGFHEVTRRHTPVISFRTRLRLDHKPAIVTTFLLTMGTMLWEGAGHAGEHLTLELAQNDDALGLPPCSALNDSISLARGIAAAGTPACCRPTSWR